MLSRRRLLASAALVGVAAAMPARLLAAAQDAVPLQGALTLGRNVDVMIGTGGHGHVYPGATVPFGMVQLSPDTDNARWDACSGYHIDDETLLGFSHTHLSGTGVGDMLDLLVVPRTGPVVLSPGTLDHPEGSYRQPLHHDRESASPGYYRLVLPQSGVEGGITAELTASKRAGMHRYGFPTGQDIHLLIDWSHGARYDPATPTRVTDASLRLIGDRTLVGSRRVHKWADGRVIHFALELSQPFVTAQLYSNDQMLTPGTVAASGTALKCALIFGQSLKDPLLVKVGLSAVDIAGALGNLSHDAPGFDFDGMRAGAAKAWEQDLSRIRIETPLDTDRTIFYTSLYHSLLAPTVFSDADGRYRGLDGNVHTLRDGRGNYSTYSLWDTYRAWHPLMTLIAPERAADFAANLIDMAAESPDGPCIWPLQGVETHCMIGWHSACVIAEAVTKRLPGIDVQKAWSIYRKLAFERISPGLTAYRTLSYIPADLEAESVSRTLEYAYDDWAMAHIAGAAGDADSASQLRLRSKNYANVFDADSHFARPRLTDGSWAQPFAPNEMGHDPSKWWDYTESNAWQATFGNQHDIHSYIAMFGGDAAFEARLDALFDAPSDLPAGAPPDMSGLIGQYIHGNEPSHHIAYLYAYCGAHHKTQARARMLLATQYRAKPDGLAGNEDCGQMSAWYVLSALGLYPVDPVSGIYVFGSPIMPRADIALAGGRTLSIIADGVSETALYIREVTWNGQPWSRSWIGHAQLMGGGELRFSMSDTANPAFGADPADRPPSFTTMSFATI